MPRMHKWKFGLACEFYLRPFYGYNAEDSDAQADPCNRSRDETIPGHWVLPQMLRIRANDLVAGPYLR